MDPITALSLAAAVVQFVDFGSRLAKDAYTNYKAAEGDPSAEKTEIELTAELSKLCSQLTKHFKSNEQPSDNELAIQKLAQACHNEAQSLVKLLASHTVPDTSTGISRGWDALRKALRHGWNKNQIQEFERKLDRIQLQLSLHLLVTVK